MCHDYCHSMYTTEFSLHFDSSRIIHQMISMVFQHHMPVAHHLVANGYVSMSHIYFNIVVQCSSNLSPVGQSQCSSNLSPVGQSHLNKNKSVDLYAKIPNFRNIASSRNMLTGLFWLECAAIHLVELVISSFSWWTSDLLTINTK